MNVAAGDGATWGISGPVFLLVFLGAAAAILIWTLAQRRRLFAGTGDTRVDQVGPHHAAYLAGGPRLAVFASLSGLRTAGAVDAGPDRLLLQSGPLPAGATPLDQAVHHAAGQRLRARDLPDNHVVRGALDDARLWLERTGLAVPAATRRAARRGPLLLVGLFAIGVARLYAGVANGRPVALLALALAAVGIAAVVLLARVPRSTAAAGRAIAALRSRYAHLAPQHATSYAPYGMPGAAMGVALFGAAAVWAADPAFAAAADLDLASARSATTGAGYPGGSAGGGGDGGGGGSCGGGGGGGCGGGGCGG
ncbi:MAG TPA: TIGR04222 domain-containing membrane protein [Pilimelia sp.]|nr:TIGR04222 domain-containing membrane protein [Pilimelia sp.]